MSAQPIVIPTPSHSRAATPKPSTSFVARDSGPADDGLASGQSNAVLSFSSSTSSSSILETPQTPSVFGTLQSHGDPRKRGSTGSPPATDPNEEVVSAAEVSNFEFIFEPEGSGSETAGGNNTAPSTHFSFQPFNSLSLATDSPEVIPPSQFLSGFPTIPSPLSSSTSSESLGSSTTQSNNHPTTETNTMPRFLFKNTENTDTSELESSATGNLNRPKQLRKLSVKALFKRASSRSSLAPSKNADNSHSNASSVLNVSGTSLPGGPSNVASSTNTFETNIEMGEGLKGISTVQNLGDLVSSSSIAAFAFSNTRLKLQRRSNHSLTESSIVHPLMPMPNSDGALFSTGAPRSTTAPLLPSAEVVLGTLSHPGESSPTAIDNFSRLPHELQIKVFSTLLDCWKIAGGSGRWQGEAGGRRELIRLSRVSKSWRCICLDGQLWNDACFSPLSSKLHPATLQLILGNSRTFIKSLLLQGLDQVDSPTLLGPEIPRYEYGHLSVPMLSVKFTMLTTLDLRGCKSLATEDMVAIIQASPGLKSVDVKNLDAASIVFLESIVDYVDALESLDVSRCRYLHMRDINLFIRRLSDKQRAALKTLRLAGLSCHECDLLRSISLYLPNLECLDFSACMDLDYMAIKMFVDVLGERIPPLKRESSLRHLVLSSCKSLTQQALDLLIGYLPNMVYFEAAGLGSILGEESTRTLALLLRSMPNLERLDLEGTGRHGAVNDAVINELIPGEVTNSQLVESRLVELKISGAKHVSSLTLLHLVRKLTDLSILEVDGTEADQEVMREFITLHPEPQAYISLLDCHRLTYQSYSALASQTRPRQAWKGYSALPFNYGDDPFFDEEKPKPVLRTFWGWRRVSPPTKWREERMSGEVRAQQVREEEAAAARAARGFTTKSGRRATLDASNRRRSAWRRGDESDFDRGACSIQ